MKQLFVFACLIFSQILAFAQQKDEPIQFANGDFITGSNISRQTFKTENINAAIYQDKYFVLIQFQNLPTNNFKDLLKREGISLEVYLPGNAYMATVNKQFDFAKASKLSISSINIVPAFYKIDQKINAYRNGNKDQTWLLAVTYFSAIDKKIVASALQDAGATITTTKFTQGNTIFIQVNKALVNTIATLPYVLNISLQTMQDKELNYNNISAHAISGLNAVTGRNLNGKGVTVGVGDNSEISTHIDFTGRLIDRTSTIPAPHGTHTSGTTAGGGIANVKYRGMAAKATIVSQYFSDIIVNTPAYITDYNLIATNNSYHSAEAGCPGNGEYNYMSFYADRQLAQNKEVLHVVAAGNDGGFACSPYPAAFATVKSGWQSAKNVLTVGAITTTDYSIGGFSSRGPVKDGRIKPEIVAGGVNVISTLPYNAYGSNTGTSMATPVVTGTTALLYERYRQLNGGANPKAALIKAIMCNTAEDLGNYGPDFTYGFGMLNARRAVEAIENNHYITNTALNANIKVNVITVPANIRRLKIMLYWSDSAATTNAGNALVSDLDLTVVTPARVLHRPLILNASSGGVNNVATEFPDHINNIEQVVVENPPAGDYSINVNGYKIPFGSQDYVLSYEMIEPDINVEYPYGGETLVPGETETIRWNAYDDNTSKFTLEYSTNNGTSWSLITDTAGAQTKTYNWTVPATVTNTALIRVSRNNTSLSATSVNTFTVLGQPVVTGTVVCEGAVQLSWPAISGAGSYDVVQFDKDSMKVVGNTSATSYLITGLDKTKAYWLGAVAKNGTNAGRRSLSVRVVPASGACSLSAFNNDVKADAILEPTTARQQFANAANATKPVKITIKNLGTVAVTGPFNVSYSYNGTVVTETLNTTIAASSIYTYTFTGMYPVVASGYLYNFKAWVTHASDGNHLNDTAYKTVKYINNDPVTTTPLVENFDAMPAAEFVQNELAIGANDKLDFFTSSVRGRARTFVNTGFALSGKNALTLDQTPYSDTSTSDSAIVSYNLSQLSNSQLRYDLYYKNHGQANYLNNRIWIRGSETSPWIEAYNLYSNQADLGNWKKALININEVLANASPAQTMTATFQIKIGEQGNTSANNVTPVVDTDDGYTFDDLVLTKADNDIAVTAINSPDQGGCSLPASSPVSIKIKNYNNTVLNNVAVSYRINGGAIVTETVASLAPNQTLDYVFNKLADFSAYTDYNIEVWAKFSGDTYAANDSILDYSIHNSPLISSYPYLQTFENSDGFFYTKGVSSTWQWGTPAATVINKAANGNKAWVTNLVGNYSDNETSYLISPCFDISGLQKPVLSFSHIFDVETDYDFTWVEYTTDGKLWQKLGTSGSGTNWYDNAAANNWRLSNKKWHVASIDLPVTAGNIRFRFVMSSDGGVTQEGVGIDDIRIHEKSDIAGAGGVVYSDTLTGGWDNNWVPFTYGNQASGPFYTIAEINSFGQDLGTVTVTPYLNYPGPVRYTSDQYYLNRNFVIQSTKQPKGNVGVRLYFTDTDANALINSTACPTCGKPADAYELGVTAYKGTPSEENGTLNDNLNGFYQQILPANTLIYPHGNGYYAEFTISNFGEFWFGKGKITPCPGGSVSYSVPGGAASYQWQVNTGSGYANIINGASYSGVTTNLLQISNLPTTSTGYTYRCVVAGVNSAEFVLRFNNNWTGTNSNDWFDTGNWGCGSIPDQYSDVTIPTGLANYPVINASTSVRAMRILAGASVIVNAGIVFNLMEK